MDRFLADLFENDDFLNSTACEAVQAFTKMLLALQHPRKECNIVAAYFRIRAMTGISRNIKYYEYNNLEDSDAAEISKEMYANFNEEINNAFKYR